MTTAKRSYASPAASRLPHRCRQDPAPAPRPGGKTIVLNVFGAPAAVCASRLDQRRREVLMRQRTERRRAARPQIQQRPVCVLTAAPSNTDRDRRGKPSLGCASQLPPRKRIPCRRAAFYNFTGLG